MTLPFEPSTLPKRTADEARLRAALEACTISSATRLVAPMTLRGVHRLVGGDQDEVARRRARRRARPRCACRGRCSSSPRAGCAPSSARACARRRGRPRSGGRRAKTPSSRSLEQDVARARARGATPGMAASSSMSSANRPFSAGRRAPSAPGCGAIWRHSSEPMEPAAPVTSTACPRGTAAPRSVELHRPRASRSSTLTSRICVYMTRPSTSSPRLGSTRLANAAPRRTLDDAPQRGRHADGIAISTSPTSYCAHSVGCASIRAQHRQAADAEPDLRADRRRRSRPPRSEPRPALDLLAAAECPPSRRQRSARASRCAAPAAGRRARARRGW